MDSWVNDSFYSKFPSYSEQANRREALAKARQLEYQTYLSRVSSNSPKTNTKSNKRTSINDKNLKRPKIPTIQNVTVNKPSPLKQKSKIIVQNVSEIATNDVDDDIRSERTDEFLNQLEQKPVPEIFDEESIRARNEKMAEEKRLQNIRYQQELMAQIEQKRRERELQKAKEREEEERLTRRMEEQLKSVRLQYEMEQVRPTHPRDYKRINTDFNKAAAQNSLKLPNTVRSENVEPIPYTFRSYDERQAQSENGKENVDVTKRNDKEIYNFFTNSARDRNAFRNLRYNNYGDYSDGLSDFDITPNSMSSAYNTYPSTGHHNQNDNHNHNLNPNHNHNQSKNRPMCNFCKQHGYLARSQHDNTEKGLYFCDSCENQPICLTCRKEICIRCKKPTNNEYHLTKPPKQRLDDYQLWQPRNNAVTDVKYVRTDNFQPIEFNDGSSTGSDTNDHKPYSFNIAESSLFHPSKSRIDRQLSVSVKNGEISVKPDSFEELKRITNEKIMKYAKNYGDLRFMKTLDSKPNAPLPSVSENTKKLMDFAKQLEKDEYNNDLKQTNNSKWQISAGSNREENNSTTLTQVGAFKKHLNIDKLKLDDRDF